MANFTIGRFGVYPETTYGIRAIPTEWRNLLENQKMQFPKEKVNTLVKLLASSFVPGNISINEVDITFTLTGQLIDPQIISYIANSSAITTGSGSYSETNRFLFSPLAPSQAFEPDSLTGHMEIYSDEAMTTLVNAWDIPGLQIVELKVYHIADDPQGMLCDVTFQGQRLVEQNPTTNLYGQSTGTTADPEESTGANCTSHLGVTLTLPNSYTNCVSSDIGKTVTGGTTGDTGILKAYNNTTQIWLVDPVDSGDLFDQAEAYTIGSGTGAGTSTSAGDPAGSAALDSISDGVSFTSRVGTYYETDPDPFYLKKTSTFQFEIGGTIDLTSSSNTLGETDEGGTDLTSIYRGMDLTFTFNYKKSRAQRNGYTNYGVSSRAYLKNAFAESISINLAVVVDANSTSSALELNKYKQVTNKAIFLKFQKIRDSGDWFALCFAPTSGSPENVFTDLSADFPFLTISNFFQFTWECTYFNCVVANDFSALRGV